MPPPIGGVTISIKNLKIALEELKHSVKILSLSDFIKIKRFDIGHIHFSKRYKVIISILFSKILCKKTIVTKHGANFHPKKNLIDKIILNMSNGFITLNNEVFQRCKRKEHCIKLPPIFKEGIEKREKSNKKYFIKDRAYKYILLYASNKAYINQKEVYGVNFTLESMKYLSKNVKLIILDPSGEYKDDIKSYKKENIVYINKYVDFNILVSQVDIYLRPTTSDGNSVATLEALSLNIPVVASDIVERASGILCYKAGDKKDFISKIDYILKNKKQINSFQLQSIDIYIEFCNNILTKSY
jgi:glycosyltransferase involved in cell wall biosynthesis